MTVISAPAILVSAETGADSGIVGPGAVVVEDGSIVDVVDHVPKSAADHVQLPTGLLSAGMIDLQINGCFGVDFANASAEDWTSVRRQLVQTGVTTFLPTLITTAIEDLVKQLNDVAGQVNASGPPGSARALGVHLEGPFLSPLRAGAHDPGLMSDPEDSILDQLLADGRDALVSLVTLAPERAGSAAAIRRLCAAGIVVSVGHTDAIGEQVSSAADAGASMVTHIFNAQRGLHHREPGVPGIGLTDPRFRVGLIADFHHVDPEVIKLTFAAAPGRVVLVTDAVAAAGMPPGTNTLGNDTTVVVGPDQPPRRVDGTLAGSTLTLDQAVRNVVALGISRDMALRAATQVPAQALGRTDLGVLTPGAIADIVWWDHSLAVREVWVGGVRASQQ
ncbi:MAG TPA: N-acetylglucosamine-6-phosphate deacetylase [Actinomycetes bacterium]|nr:N-acetylglucosamine-6-phosphate deacetylase [Actinomycetes bacterium]